MMKKLLAALFVFVILIAAIGECDAQITLKPRTMYMVNRSGNPKPLITDVSGAEINITGAVVTFSDSKTKKQTAQKQMTIVRKESMSKAPPAGTTVQILLSSDTERIVLRTVNGRRQLEIIDIENCIQTTYYE